MLFAIAGGHKGPTEPVWLVYRGEVTTLSKHGDAAGQPGCSDWADPGFDSTAPTGNDYGTPAKRKKIRYSAPIPVLLTRYAAQSLYAPARTVEAVPGIPPGNPHRPRRVSTLYPLEPLTVKPPAGWVRGRAHASNQVIYRNT
ncbi:DUF3438 family protein, partial [Cronobacter sakazakii]|uniref:DUF3438 family protein n=1 Tax=Cronobacter sakazakii TaxID=28141 RepID=UPI00294B64B9